MEITRKSSSFGRIVNKKEITTMIKYTVKVDEIEKVFTSLIDAQEYLSDVLDKKDIVDYRKYEVKLIADHFVEV